MKKSSILIISSLSKPQKYCIKQQRLNVLSIKNSKISKLYLTLILSFWQKYLFTGVSSLWGRGPMKLIKGLSDKSVTSHPSPSRKSSSFSLVERKYLLTIRGYKTQSHPELLIL